MGTSGGRRIESSRRRRSVAGYGILSIVAAALIAGAFEVGFASVTWGLVIVVYTIYGTALTASLALLYLLAPVVPAQSTTMIDDEAARGFRGWPWERWWDLGLSAGLVATFVVLAVLAFDASEVVIGILLLLPGLGALGSLALAAMGRRRNEAVWLTADRVIADSENGRASVARADVWDVEAIGSAVFVKVRGPITRTAPPWPWRKAPRSRSSRMLVLCDLLGLDPAAMRDWLRAELSLDQPDPAEHPPARGVVPRLRAWWNNSSS